MLSASNVILSEVSDQSALQEIFALRVIAWRSQAEIPSHVEIWTDRYDESAHHWGIFRDGRIVASARLSVHDDLFDIPDSEIYRKLTIDQRPPIASMNRCVVHPDFRHQGFASMLDRVSIDKAREIGCRMIVLAVDDERRLWQMQSYGFRNVAEGDPYTDGPNPGSRGTICVLNIL